MKFPWISAAVNVQRWNSLPLVSFRGWTHEFFVVKFRCDRWWQLKHFWNFQPGSLGKWSNFDEHIFQMGWFNHQLEVILSFRMRFGCDLFVTYWTYGILKRAVVQALVGPWIIFNPSFFHGFLSNKPCGSRVFPTVSQGAPPWVQLPQSCRIALNYVKTWFPLDVVVVGIDWWFQTQQTNGAEGEGVFGWTGGKGLRRQQRWLVSNICLGRFYLWK